MAQSHNLLSGKISRQLVLLALPLVVGEILQQLYNTVDSLIIGRFLGTEAFAAAGVSGSVMNLFIFVLSGFCIGVSVLFSRDYGAADMNSFRRTCYTAVVFGTAFTLLVSLAAVCLTAPVLRLMATPEDLLPYCRRYLTIILSGLITTYFYNLFSAILRAIGKTGMALLFLAVSVGANVVLDLLLVAVIPLGIGGAAAATVLAQLVSAVSCLLFLNKKYPQLLCRKEDTGYYPELLKQIFSYGTTSALHQSSLYIGKLMVQGIVNSCGTAVIAAFTATTRIEAFINSPGNGFAQAEAVFVAQNRGAGNRKRALQGVKASFVLIEGFVLVFSVIMYFAAPHAIRLFLAAGETEALRAGTEYLKVIFFFYFLGYGGYFFVGAARGYGKMKVPLTATTMHLSARILFAWFTIGRFGLSAVAWATGFGWLLSCCYHSLMFRRYTAADRLELR
ncbi:MAG: MATE family efflux transporter [Oscillospiraceae bacterium]|nr:MATE family efflux transporter [Oscillospiraceae bacterium]